MYEFIGVCTAGNDGRPWPIDNAGLDSKELEWINKNIDRDADVIFFFGHHPLDDLEYGREEFQSMLEDYPSVYIYGHTHSYGIDYYNNTMLVNAASLGKSSKDHYLLVTVDNEGVASVTPYTVPQLPF
jgi:Icc-related predicted phosphoesterase